MKNVLLFGALVVLFGPACNRDVSQDVDHELEHLQTTKWTEWSELFMEYPPLFVGEQHDFILHLTELNHFKPVNAKDVTLLLTSEGNRIEKTIAEPTRNGIYTTSILFDESGTWQMVLSYGGPRGDTVRVDNLIVFAEKSREQIETAALHHEGSDIRFLKEQQWNTDFGTEGVTRRSMRASIPATGEILSKINSDVIVSSPFTGMVLSDHNPDLPQIGSAISTDSKLVVLTPSVDSGEDNFAAKYIQRKSDLELARIEMERAERLFARSAIPERELQQSQADFQKAEAEYGTIATFVEEFNYTEQFGTDHLDLDFLIRSPIIGTVEEIYFQPGRQINSGEPLFRIIDSRKVWLKINVPATLISQINNPDRLSFTIHGRNEPVHITPDNGTLVSIGNIVDTDNRTVPLVFEIANPSRLLKIGMYADVLVFTDEKKDVLAVPESALTEDEGHYSIYVQLAGESFMKREVTPGIKESGYVEILDGLNEAERVVTSGAYQVKLASASSRLPDDGHVH